MWKDEEIVGRAHPFPERYLDDLRRDIHEPRLLNPPLLLLRHIQLAPDHRARALTFFVPVVDKRRVGARLGVVVKESSSVLLHFEEPTGAEVGVDLIW